MSQLKKLYYLHSPYFSVSDFLIQKYLFYVKEVNYKKWEKLKKVNPRECDYYME